MQKISKTFLALAVISAFAAISFDVNGLDHASSDDAIRVNAYYQFAQHLFMLSGVLVICATALLYKYGWGAAKQQDAAK